MSSHPLNTLLTDFNPNNDNIEWFSSLSEEGKKNLTISSTGSSMYMAGMGGLIEHTFEKSAAKFATSVGREFLSVGGDILFGIADGKSGDRIAAQVVGSTTGGAAGLIVGAPLAPATGGLSMVVAPALFSWLSGLGSEAMYVDLMGLSNSNELQTLPEGSRYYAMTQNGKTYQCYHDPNNNNNLTIEEFFPAPNQEIRPFQQTDMTFKESFTDGSSLEVTFDESAKAIKELKFNSTSTTSGSEVDDLADAFNVDENDAPLIKDGAKIISEDSNGALDEQIFNHGDIANIFAAEGLSLNDPSVASKKLNPDGSVSYSLAPPSAQLNDVMGNSFSLGNVADMFFGRDGAIATFVRDSSNRLVNFYKDPAGILTLQTALANVAVRLANGEDFDDIVADTVATLLLSHEVSVQVGNLIEGTPAEGTSYESYLHVAISSFLLSSIVNGGEDMAQAAQNASVQQAINYTLANGLSDIFGEYATNKAGEYLYDNAGNRLYQLTPGGMAAAAAAFSLASSALSGDSIGEEQVGQALIAAATTYAATQLAAYAATTTLFSTLGVGAGPLGVVIGFAIGAAVQEILAPTVHDDTTESHRIVDNGDGTVTLIGLREAGSLLRTVGNADDDFTGNDSADDTTGHDVIVGQAGANEIYALGGHDFIEGRANADYIEAGTGNDHVEAGSGDDFVDGGAGSDKIYGQAGDDNIIGGDGEDILLGGAGNDMLEGGADNDRIFGAEGNDTASGGAGADDISGGSGTDTLSGDDGDDTIDGGEGDDDIFGDDGDDVIYAGAGSDTARGGNDNDTIFGETGVDMLYGNAGDDIIDGGNQDDLVFGGIGSDTILGGYGDDDLYGEIGNDLLVGGRDDDTLDGGDGDDVYMYSTGDGDDVITDTDGTNVIKFTNIDVADVAFTEVGNDLVLTMNGTNTITVQDYFVVNNLEEIEFADERRVVMTDVTFAAGVGTVNSIQGTASAYVTALANNIRNVSIISSPWHTNALPSTTWFTNNYDTNANPAVWDAEIYNDVQVDIWNKSTGFFGLRKSMGFYDYHEKYLKGSAVDDRIVGMWWSEVITGNAGNDQIYGNMDSDTVDGGAEHDLIFGGEGNDTLNGGSGTDMLVGGHGDDIINGEDGNDTIFGEWGNDTITGGFGDDFAEGGLGNDNISGNEGDDLLFGEEGDDTIDGGTGDDYLYGGEGTDNITAGEGNDLIFGSTGNDTIDGGTGNDTAVFSGLVNDYTVSVDANGALTVTDNVGNDGTDTLTDVETLQFADGEFDVLGAFPDHSNHMTVAKNSSFAGSYALPAGYTISLVQGPTNGVFNLNADGTFDYTANHTYTAQDSFIYKLTSPIGTEKTYTTNLNLVGNAAISQAFTMGAEEQVGTFSWSGSWADKLERVKAKSAALSGGGHVVVWATNTPGTVNDGNAQGVIAQRYNASGAKVGSEFVVNTTTTGNQQIADVIGTNDGGFTVVWSSDGNIGDTGFGNYMQSYNASGVKIGGEVAVSSNVTGDQIYPSIEELTNGSRVVTWASNHGGTSNVYFKVLSNTGTELVSETQVNGINGNENTLPVIASLSGGGFAIVWQGVDGSSGPGIQARVYSNTGVAQTSDILVNTHITQIQKNPAVTALAGGGFVVTWSSINQDGAGYGIYAQKFDASGTKVGSEFLVNTTTHGHQDISDVLGLADGGFMVAWGSEQDGSQYGTYAQRFDSNGNKVGDETQINVTTNNYQFHPSLSQVSNGDVIVTWMDYEGTPDIVRQRRLSLTASALESSLNGQNNIDDIVIGGDANDIMHGLSGDDILSGGEGDDTLDGGDGTDTAVFSGNFADYAIAGDGTTFTITDNVGTDGTDTLTNIETAEFADTSLSLELLFPDHPNLLKSAQNSISTGQLALPVGYTIALVTAPATGLLVLNADGTYSYSSVAGDATTDSFTYRVTSPLGIDKVYTMDIEVSNLADSGTDFTNGAETTVALFDYVGGGDNPERLQPSVAQLENGGHVVFWVTDTKASVTDDGNGFGIIGQRYDNTGAKVGGEFVANTYTAGSQHTISAEGFSDGSFAVVWTSSGSQNQDGSGEGIFMQKYDSAGVPIGGETQINESTYGNQNYPDIKELKDNNILIVWSSKHLNPNEDIYYKVISPTGTTVIAETPVNSYTTDDQHKAEASALENGGFVIAWEDQSGNGGSSTDIKYKIYDEQGVSTSGEMVANTYTSSHQDSVDVSSLKDGGFVITWTSASQDGSGDGIYAQKFSSNGLKVGQEIQVNTYTSSNQYQSEVIGLTDGGYFIVWSSKGQDGSYEGVYGQRFDLSGSKVGSEIAINSNTSNIQRLPSITELENGSLVVNWYDLQGSPDSIKQKVLISDGNGGVLLKGFDDDRNILSGGAFGDHLYGGSDDDVLTGNDGNDAIDGGAGTDTAVFSGNLADYNISLSGNTITVQDTVGTNGTDTLTNIEQLQFADGTFDVAATFPDQLENITSAQGGLYDGQLDVPVGYTAAVVTAPVSGVLVLNADGSYTYTAPNGFVGTETFTYTITSPLGIEKSYTTSVEVLGVADGGESYTETAEASVGSNEIPSGWVYSRERIRSKVAALSGGGHIVTWSTFVNTDPGHVDDGTGFGIIARRYDENGNAVGNSFVVNTTTTANQYTPDVASLDDGGFIVAWSTSTGSSGDGSAYGSYMQRYDSAGVKVGGETLINTTTSNDQYYPRMTELSNGDLLITWSSQHDGSWDIYHKLYDSSGNVLQDETKVNTVTAGSQDLAVVASLADGGYAISWEQQDASTGDGREVKYRVYNSDGTARTDELTANTYITSHQDQPSIAGLLDGSFMIVWTSRDQDGSYDGIFTQRFAADGSKIGLETQVNTESINDQYMSDITALSDGGYYIVWTSRSQDGDSTGIYGQRYDVDGNAIGAETQINTTTVGEQLMPSITETLNGNLVISWMDFNLGDPTFDNPIRQKILVSDGAGGAYISGSDDNDVLVGGINNDTLIGKLGDDDFTGNDGDDTMVGNDGDDTYRVAFNQGDDIIDNQDAAGTDTVVFSNGEEDFSLWFSRSGFDLKVDYLDNNGSLTFKNWYVNDEQKVDSIELDNGTSVDQSGINQLVSAMAGFDPALFANADDITDLPTEVQDAITASWV